MKSRGRVAVCVDRLAFATDPSRGRSSRRCAAGMTAPTKKSGPWPLKGHWATSTPARSHEASLVPVLKNKQSEQGYQQGDSQPQHAAQEGSTENQHQHQPAKSNPVRNVWHRDKSPLSLKALW